MKKIVIEEVEFAEDTRMMEGDASRNGWEAINEVLEADWETARNFKFPVTIEVDENATEQDILDLFNEKYFLFAYVIADKLYVEEETE